ENVPPTWTYSAEQLAVLNQYGVPHIYTIVQFPQGPTRYESWLYFGTIRKQFGFSNGKKVAEATVPFGFPFAPAVTPPKQFTCNTTRANLVNLLGPPSSVLPGEVQGEK